MLLDTHAWIWYLNGAEALSNSAREAIASAMAERTLSVSTISCWEVHMLAARGRLRLSIDSRQWTRRATRLPFIDYVAPDDAILAESVYLPGAFHRDPADRIIVATARILGCPVISADAKIQAYPFVDVVW
ncbi:MAG: type II toxin-antitoxin system VapC family toxin [Candidatus Dadabacteria bacterium]|nr:MAG: type II toxin-antitoxin system VapC family toxin [Candidatus Dadabacteria bacterium]